MPTTSVVRTLLPNMSFHNLIPNPSFEGATTNLWDLESTFTVVTGIIGSIGTHCVQDVCTGSGDFHNFNTHNSQGAGLPVLINTTYTLSFYAIINNINSKAPFFHIYSGSAFGTDLVPQQQLTNTNGYWQRFSTTFNSGPNTKVWVRFNNWQGTGTNYFDAFQLELGPIATPYFDGSSGPGYSWDGTPSASASTYNAPFPRALCQPRTVLPLVNTDITQNVTNLVANPSLEGPITGNQTWDIQTPGPWTIVTGIAGSTGLHCLQDIYTHVGDHTNDFSNFNTSNNTAAGIPVLPNTVYTLSFYAIINVTNGNRPHCDINGGSAFGTTISPSGQLAQTASMTWQRFTRTFNTGGNSLIYIRIWNDDGGLNNAAVCYFDAFQIELGSVATPYFDGDSQGCVWNGAPYTQGATSTRYANVQRSPVT
jgi:hypothetical protein